MILIVLLTLFIYPQLVRVTMIVWCGSFVVELYIKGLKIHGHTTTLEGTTGPLSLTAMTAITIMLYMFVFSC